MTFFIWDDFMMVDVLFLLSGMSCACAVIGDFSHAQNKRLMIFDGVERHSIYKPKKRPKDQTHDFFNLVFPKRPSLRLCRHIGF